MLNFQNETPGFKWKEWEMMAPRHLSLLNFGLLSWHNTELLIFDRIVWLFLHVCILVYLCMCSQMFLPKRGGSHHGNCIERKRTISQSTPYNFAVKIDNKEIYSGKEPGGDGVKEWELLSDWVRMPKGKLEPCPLLILHTIFSLSIFFSLCMCVYVCLCVSCVCISMCVHICTLVCTCV